MSVKWWCKIGNTDGWDWVLCLNYYGAVDPCCSPDLGVTAELVAAENLVPCWSWTYTTFLKRTISIILCKKMKKKLKSRQGGKLILSCREQKGKLMFPDGKEHVLLHVQKRSHIPPPKQNMHLTNLLTDINSRIYNIWLRFFYSNAHNSRSNTARVRESWSGGDGHCAGLFLSEAEALRKKDLLNVQKLAQPHIWHRAWLVVI